MELEASLLAVLIVPEGKGHKKVPAIQPNESKKWDNVSDTMRHDLGCDKNLQELAGLEHSPHKGLHVIRVGYSVDDIGC